MGLIFDAPNPPFILLNQCAIILNLFVLISFSKYIKNKLNDQPCSHLIPINFMTIPKIFYGVNTFLQIIH